METLVESSKAMETMKAIRLHSRDSGPAGLVFEDVARPKPSNDEVLVRVWAAGVTPKEVDWTLWTDENGMPRQYPILSHEFSGVVESMGQKIRGFRVGDEVYGFTAFERDGAFAEYTIAHPDEISLKPKSISHIEAAAVPMSGLTAWQALFDHAKLTAGQSVLVQGAAGGVGTFAVQLGRWGGSRVIATASKENLDFLRRIGANEALDYNDRNFDGALHDIDVVLNTVRKEVGERSLKVLRKGGILVSTTAGNPSVEKAEAFGVKTVYFIVKPSADQLAKMTELIDEKHVTPIIQTVMPLSQAREAFDLGLQGHNRGKIILKVAREP